MTRTKRRQAPASTRPLDVLLDGYPGTQVELAAALGVSRQTLWTLRTATTVKRPVPLLRLYVDALEAAGGMVDGSAMPSLGELVRAWDAVQRS